ncbi:MAG: molecular chaperone TorD family protein [Acidobacteria bacterium]|nr:molecular chaperone TorD family protein [Acidobacteriota bacterium]
MSASVSEPAVRALLGEAAEWRLLGLLFERPREGWHESVAELAPEVADPLLQDAAAAALEEATEGMYHAVLGPSGGVSVREAGYSKSIQTGAQIADLKAFYDAFAYAPVTDEPPDHLSVEAGFLGFLKLKQAFAEMEGEPEHVSLTKEAAREFLESHMALCAQPLVVALGDTAPVYMQLAAAALAARSPEAPPQPHSPFTEMMEGCELSCGLGDPAAEETPA